MRLVCWCCQRVVSNPYPGNGPGRWAFRPPRRSCPGLLSPFHPHPLGARDSACSALPGAARRPPVQSSHFVAPQHLSSAPGEEELRGLLESAPATITSSVPSEQPHNSAPSPSFSSLSPGSI